MTEHQINLPTDLGVEMQNRNWKTHSNISSWPKFKYLLICLNSSLNTNARHLYWKDHIHDDISLNEIMYIKGKYRNQIIKLIIC